MMKNCNNYDKDKERDRILEEARKIEEELGPDLEFPETEEEVDAAYQRLLIRLQEEQEKEKECAKPPSKSRKSRIHSSMVALGKCAAIVVVTLFGMFTLSMTSEANREWVMRRVNYVLGGGEIAISIGNEGEWDNNALAEEIARERIEKLLSVELPTLLYRPMYLVYDSYIVGEENQVAKLFYDYQGEKISLFVKAGGEIQDNYLHIDGKVEEIGTVEEETVNIECFEISNQEDSEQSYFAIWEYGNCYYQLSGKIKREEFMNIIKNLHF